MKPYRLERMEKELLRIANNTLKYKMSDSRLQLVTITEVQISPDMQFAKLYFSVLEEEADINQWTVILIKASGVFKKEIAAAKIMRRIPELRFIYDDTGDRVREVESVFEKIKKNKKQTTLE